MINIDCKEICLCKKCILNISDNKNTCLGCKIYLVHSIVVRTLMCEKSKLFIDHLKFKKWIKR